MGLSMDEQAVLFWLAARTGQPVAVLAAAFAVWAVVQAAKLLTPLKRAKEAVPLVAVTVGLAAGLSLIGLSPAGAAWGIVIGALAIGEHEYGSKWGGAVRRFLGRPSSSRAPGGGRAPSTGECSRTKGEETDR